VQTLENPFLGERPRFSPLPRPPKRRRRQAPARGLAVVYAHDRPKRNEAQRIRPLLVGRMRVDTAPKAPAAGTAGCVYTAPKALAADTVGVGVGSGVGVGVASMMTATSCMPTIFHLPSLFISVMSYLLPCQVGTVGLTSLRMLEI